MINQDETLKHNVKQEKESREEEEEEEEEREIGMKHLLNLEKETRDYSEENTPGEDLHQEKSDERENSKEEFEDINDMNENEREYYVGGGGEEENEKIKKRNQEIDDNNNNNQDGGVLLKRQKSRMNKSIIFLGQNIDDETTSKFELMTKEEKENLIRKIKDAMDEANSTRCNHCKNKSYQVHSTYDIGRLQKKIFFKCYKCNDKKINIIKEKKSQTAIPLEYYVILNLGEVIRLQSEFSVEMKNQIMVNKNNFMFGFVSKEEAETIHNNLFRKLILVQEGFVKYLHMYMVLGYGFMPEESTTVSSLMQKYTQEDIHKMFDGETKEEERKNLETAIQENIQKLKNFVQEKNMNEICKTSDAILEQMRVLKSIFHLQNSIYGEIYLTLNSQQLLDSSSSLSITSNKSSSVSSTNSSLSTGGNKGFTPSRNSRTPKYLMTAYKQYKMFPRKHFTIKRNQNKFLLQDLKSLPLLNIYI